MWSRSSGETQDRVTGEPGNWLRMGMNLQTFKAPTMAECLAEVKRVMGTDAVILHTRTYVTRQWLGLRRREVVEITAGRGLNSGARGSRRIGTVQPRYMEAPAPPPQQRPALAPPAEVNNGHAVLQSPAGSTAIMVGLSNDMGK